MKTVLARRDQDVLSLTKVLHTNTATIVKDSRAVLLLRSVFRYNRLAPVLAEGFALHSGEQFADDPRLLLLEVKLLHYLAVPGLHVGRSLPRLPHLHLGPPPLCGLSLPRDADDADD